MVQVASLPGLGISPDSAAEVLRRWVVMPWIDGAARSDSTRERSQIINPADDPHRREPAYEGAV
jgi:hypothetical protein